ncbi:MAG: 2Fe-2S iron-sulfur cluster binding domain-containing protein [Agarilytica sp.]
MSYSVRLKPSATVFSAEKGECILSAALKNNIHLEYSCNAGDCGTCEARLVAGEVLLNDGSTLTEGPFLTCNSVPLSDLEIEISFFPELSRIQKKTVPAKVSRCKKITDDVLVLSVRTPPRNGLDYLAGQYVNISYGGVTRSYSIASMKKEEGELEFHIRYMPYGKMSKLLFNDLQENTLMRLSGPHGTFFVRDSEAPIIFLAGGTGYAPVKAMVESLIDNNTARRIFIYWGMPFGNMFYCSKPLGWGKNYNNVDYVPVVSGEDSGWDGRAGFVHQAVLDDFESLAEYHVYACGSPHMIEAARSSFLNQGMNANNFHSDAFTAAKI